MVIESGAGKARQNAVVAPEFIEKITNLFLATAFRKIIVAPQTHVGRNIGIQLAEVTHAATAEHLPDVIGRMWKIMMDHISESLYGCEWREDRHISGRPPWRRKRCRPPRP